MRIGPGLGVAMLAVAAASCTTSQDVAVRPVGLPASAAGGALAEARAQLALGNVGLAIEQFRVALRQAPRSVDSLVGIARCYELMGRADLSRRYFEEALAVDPANGAALGALAESLARQGRTGEATQVRAEIALRSKPQGSNVHWTIDEPSPQPPATVPPSASATVTVDLPPAAAALPPAPAATPTPAPAAAPAAGKPPPMPTPVRVTSPALVRQVRLERLSLGEVALLTTPRPLWPAPAARAATVERPDRVRLLNAARRQGLAARTRERLSSVGWRSIAIGDAPQTRPLSLVLDPAGRRLEALRLAANLRIAAVQPSARSHITVFLGRDRG